MIFSRSIAADWYLRRGIVRTGPFQGLRLQSDMPNAARCRWAGTYEKEIAGVIESFVRKQPKLIFDIGGEEGFYAVGLLYRVPTCRCIVWETSETRRRMLELNAVANGCRDRIDIRGTCDAAVLAEAVAESVPDVVVSDVEGDEIDLFTPAVLAALAPAQLLIEAHGDEIRAAMKARMVVTHDVTEFEPRPRTAADWPFRRLYATGPYKYYALQECRSKATPWLVGRPRTS